MSGINAEQESLVSDDADIKLCDGEGADTEPPHLSTRAKFWMLTKFIFPLVISLMVPSIAEQALNRGITTIAPDEMTELLASFGLGLYIVKLLCAYPLELRQCGLVLVHSRKDNRVMLLICVSVGLMLPCILIAVALSPAGVWLIRDVHRQSMHVTELTCDMILYLCGLPLLEALASYYEGGLISHKYTVYAATGKFIDMGLQILFTIAFMFTSTRTDPILIPVFALYAGYIGRMILEVGFWYVLVYPEIPEQNKDQEPLTTKKALVFWLPLTLVRLVQIISRPLINLFVSRSLSKSAGEKEAAKAIAVLTAVYPTGRLLLAFMNDIKTMIAAFHKKTATHEKFSLQVLAMFSVLFTGVAFTLNMLLFMTPGVAYLLMKRVIGLNEELANLCLTPLKLFAFICLSLGLRAFCSGILIIKKKTLFLTPSAIIRLISIIMFLFTLERAGLSGAVLGSTCLLLGFVTEALAAAAVVLLIKWMPNFSLRSLLCCKPVCRNKEEEEAQPLKEMNSLSK